MDLPTRLDLFALGRDYVTQRAKKIDPDQVNVEGTDANLFVGVGSVIGDHVTKQLAFRTSALFLDGAEDEDLDRYVYDRYNEVRKGAAAALVTGTITRATFTAGAGTVPPGTKATTDTGIEYVTITPASFGATDLTSTATLRAVQAGKETQIGVGALKRFSQPGTLFDKTLVITNKEAAAGGEPRESDDVFKDRVRTFWATARRGILKAIERGALSVPGVVSAQAIEALTNGSQPARIVNLYIADSTGVASAALAQKVLVELDDYRAGGIAVLVSTSLPLIVGIQLRLAFQANIDTITLSGNVRAAVAEFVNSLSVNGTLYLADLYSVLRRYVEDGLIVGNGTVVSPIGDLVPAVGQTIRTTSANVIVVP